MFEDLQLHICGANKRSPYICNVCEFSGTNYCMPTRWLTGPFQKSFPPWLKPLVTPLTVGGGTFRFAPGWHFPMSGPWLYQKFGIIYTGVVTSDILTWHEMWCSQVNFWCLDWVVVFVINISSHFRTKIS